MRRISIPFIWPILVFHATLLAWIGWRNSPTLDEVAHLPAGISHWRFGTFESYRVNPPLVRSVAAVPVLLTDANENWSHLGDPLSPRFEFRVGADFVNANGERSFWYYTIARWAVIPFSVLGGYFCHRWAADLYGSSAGVLALILWCFSPSILGNASLITPDAAAAALGIVAAYYFWRWLRDPQWSHTFIAGVTLGLAELTKSTWIILFLLWPILWLVWRRTSLLKLATVLMIGLYTLNVGYGFEGSFRRLGDFEFMSRALGGPDAHERPGNRFAGSWVRGLPVPVPENYLRGIDVQKYGFEKGKWSYLGGVQRFGGWWYYYLYGLAIKEPVGTWLLMLTAIWAARNGNWRNSFVLLLPSVAVLIVVSSQTGFNRYVRYVLPCLPFLFIWISQVGCWATSRLRSAWIMLCVIWSVISSMAVYPHSLSYFNELAGGPLNGHWHLVDANIDWGQDLFNLKRWVEAHPHARPLKLAYFGEDLVDPKIAGIDFAPIGETHEGWCAVSVNRLHDYRHNGNEQPEFSAFLALKPVARAGYSIYIYCITSPSSSPSTGRK